MKYYDVLRVGAKTSAPTPVVEDEQIKHVESKIDIILKEIMENRPKEMPTELANSTLKDDEVSEVVDTFCAYHDKYFSEIELRKRLDPSFIWNIPKDIYNLSHYVRERGESHLLDPLFWFCMYIVSDINFSIGKFISNVLDSITEDDLIAIDEYAKSFDDESDINETLVGEVVVENKVVDVNPEDIIPMDDDPEDVDLGSEEVHVDEAATIISKPIDEDETVDYGDEDPHVVSIDCDDEYEDDTPSEDYLSALDEIIENGKGE